MKAANFFSFFINLANFFDRWAAVTFARMIPLFKFFIHFAYIDPFQFISVFLTALPFPHWYLLASVLFAAWSIIRAVYCGLSFKYHTPPNLLKRWGVCVNVRSQDVKRAICTVTVHVFNWNKGHKTNQLLALLLVRVMWTPLLHPPWVRLMKELFRANFCRADCAACVQGSVYIF